MGEKAQHVFNVSAWGMLDIDDPNLPKGRRKVFLNQIRLVLAEHGMSLHVGIWPRHKPWYSLYLGDYRARESSRLMVSGPKMETICHHAIKHIKPSNPEK